MTTFVVQYLEPGPGVSSITPRLAREKLSAALDQLPISYVLVGWHLPQQLVDACREETSRAGANLFLWHPLLTGNGDINPDPCWQTIGLAGEVVPGFKNMPEFTFMCPNRGAVQQRVLDHLDHVLRRGDYDGVFLDRIRYPSPAADPGRWLACFCTACHAAAENAALDLASVRQSIDRLLAERERSHSFLQALLAFNSDEPCDPDIRALEQFLTFREKCISDLVTAAAQLIHSAGLAVGLDCFSPALARMVGQDLKMLDNALNARTDWVKIMTYAHALGPAGLPFEVLAISDWQVARAGQSAGRALAQLSKWTGLPLPPRPDSLLVQGLPPEALYIEIRRARAAGVRNLLAGVELVEIEGIAELNEEQISNDLRACFAAGPDGLVFSWDLWHIPPERLDLARHIWTSSNRSES